MTEWIVECSICRQPFIHESDIMPWAPWAFIQVPEHSITGNPVTRCLGNDVTGFYIARKENYRPSGKARELLQKHPELMPD